MSGNAIESLVQDYHASPGANSAMKAFLARCVERGLTPEETAELTVAMAHTGHLLKWGTGEVKGKFSVDLPSTGGIGNKTPILAPILALAAAPERIFVPKISSRGRVAGTIDILESVGYRADIGQEQYRRIVQKVGISNVVQTKDFAPVDEKLMDLRKEVGAFDQANLVVSSVLCKKLATGCRNIVVDVKAGPDCKFGDLDQTLEGAKLFVEVGRILKEKGYVNAVRAVVTNNWELQGLAHGRLVALQEVVQVLRGRGPQDLQNLSVALAARMLVTAGVIESVEEAVRLVCEALMSGQAYTKFAEYMEAHGSDPTRLNQGARYQIPVLAVEEGKIWNVDVKLINTLCQELQSTQGAKFTAGIVLGEKAKIGQEMRVGDPLATVHSQDKEVGHKVASGLLGAFSFYKGSLDVVPKPSILAEDWLEGDEIKERCSWYRTSKSSIAVIKREGQGRREYLMRYNRKWGAWNFLAGHFEPEKDTGFRDAMIREFIEEVGQEVNEDSPEYRRDFTVEPTKPDRIIELSFSGSAREWSKYEFHPFGIELKGSAVRWENLWQRHSETFRWFTLGELRAGVSTDGQAVLTPFPLGAILPLLVT